MRILHCVLILAFSILLKYVYWDSSNSLPNSPLNYLSSLQRAPPPPPRAPPPPPPQGNQLTLLLGEELASPRSNSSWSENEVNNSGGQEANHSADESAILLKK
ncbi:hypothetical protein Tco_1358780 [Tanacetum coccineum]